MSTGERCDERHPILRTRCIAGAGVDHPNHYDDHAVHWPNRGPTDPVAKHTGDGGVIRRKQMRRTFRRG